MPALWYILVIYVSHTSPSCVHSWYMSIIHLPLVSICDICQTYNAHWCPLMIYVNHTSPIGVDFWYMSVMQYSLVSTHNICHSYISHWYPLILYVIHTSLRGVHQWYMVVDPRGWYMTTLHNQQVARNVMRLSEGRFVSHRRLLPCNDMFLKAAWMCIAQWHNNHYITPINRWERCISISLVYTISTGNGDIMKI